MNWQQYSSVCSIRQKRNTSKSVLQWHQRRETKRIMDHLSDEHTCKISLKDTWKPNLKTHQKILQISFILDIQMVYLTTILKVWTYLQSYEFLILLWMDFYKNLKVFSGRHFFFWKFACQTDCLNTHSWGMWALESNVMVYLALI